jgi:glycosyltransferase involved in cell wall biosynthesis
MKPTGRAVGLDRRQANEQSVEQADVTAGNARPPEPEITRIAFVIDDLRWAAAGTEKQLLQVIARIDRARFHAHLVILRTSPFARALRPGVPVLILGVRRLFSPGSLVALWRLRAWLRRNDIAIVQTFFRDSNVLGLLAAFLARVPLRIVSRRSLSHDNTRRDRLAQRWLDRLAHFYLANGEGVREHVMAAEGVGRERIRVFYNLLDERIAAIERPAVERPEESPIVFLMIANLRAVKGHAFLLEAVARVRAQIPRARFLLVGGGPGGEPPETTEVYRLAGAMGLMGMFEFAGLQSDVARHLASADVGLLCSSSEGFSSALLEYIAVGLPCVATDVGSNRELVEEGDNGFLVPYGDVARLGEALVALYRDERLRRAMGEKGRARFAARFRPGVQMRELQDFYAGEARRRRGP